MKTKFPLQVIVLLILAGLLAACGGSHREFVAPEIDPPADLIPDYVPEGFELQSGFRIEFDGFEFRNIVVDEGDRSISESEFLVPFFMLESPLGNDLLGVHYQDGDRLLLITKSYFPDGSLDQWREIYESAYLQAEECECDCAFQIVIDVPIPFRRAEVREVQTIGETPVAILDAESLGGVVTVFVRGDYLITIKGDITLEEHLQIVESLLR